MDIPKDMVPELEIYSKTWSPSRDIFSSRIEGSRGILQSVVILFGGIKYLK
jgi:hypothetical protein